MALTLSFLCAVFSLFCGLDFFMLSGKYFFSFPGFAGPLAAIVGLIIAYMEHRARRTKKQRALPMALLLFSALSGIVSTAAWLFTFV